MAAVNNSSEEVIAESRKAKLVKKGDGKLECLCPYACLATYEACEFQDHPLVVEQNKQRGGK